MNIDFATIRKYARRYPLITLGVLNVFVLVILAIFAPVIAPFPQDVTATHVSERFLAPGPEHLFGTDELGRDIFSRVVYGTRISLSVSTWVIAFALAIGATLGIIAGYRGGLIDEIIMRITDMFLCFPSILLAMVIVTILGPGLRNAMLALVITWWPWYTRLLRSEAVSTRERDYISAAKAIGCSRIRIVFRHLLPNCMTPVLVQASMDFGSVVLTSASLSFLGLGAQSPTPEWGLMINTGRPYFLTHWWIVTFSGMAIFFTAVSFNLIGDGLRELLDPRTSKIKRKSEKVL